MSRRDLMNAFDPLGKLAGGAFLAGAGMAAILASACGGSSTSTASSAGSSSTSSSTSSSAGGASATIAAANTSVGSVLTGPSGNTVYVLLSSSGSPVACAGSCTGVWPPLTVASGTMPQAGSGVGATLATTQRSDGTTQVTAGGDPLYYFSGDNGAGQVNGQGINSFGGTWHAVQASGQAVTTGSGGSGTTTTPYGY